MTSLRHVGNASQGVYILYLVNRHQVLSGFGWEPPRPPLSLLGICHHIILFFFESVAYFFGSQGRLIGWLPLVWPVLENISFMKQTAQEELRKSSLITGLITCIAGGLFYLFTFFVRFGLAWRASSSVPDILNAWGICRCWLKKYRKEIIPSLMEV